MQLHEPLLFGNEVKYLKKCIELNEISFGKFNKKFEKKIKNLLKVKYALSVVNGTSALQIILKLAGVNQNTEVIVPTITFIAPINAIKYNNGTPIFMDNDNYLNIDIKKTIKFIKENTKFIKNISYNKKTNKKIVALIVVHTFGNAADLDDLLELCNKRNILLIEDASESLGTKYISGKYKNKYTGSIGKINCLSFNGNKIVTSGGGGMILTNSKFIYEKAKYLINQAKNDSIKYIHNELGYNFRLSNIHAAIGLAQLEKLNYILRKKEIIYQKYNNKIKKIHGLKLLKGPSYAKNNYWLNLLYIENSYKKKPHEIMKKFYENNIFARYVWYPNHLQKIYKNCENFQIKNAQKLVKKILCLPSSTNLKTEDINKINNILVKLNN